METQQRSTDREIGEIVATLKAMEANNNRQFAELSREMEKLSNQFTEYKADHDKQALKDYEYLDGKVGKIDSRVTQLENVEGRRAGAKDTPWGRFLVKVQDTAAALVAAGIVAFVVWLIVLYVKAGPQ